MEHNHTEYDPNTGEMRPEEKPMSEQFRIVLKKHCEANCKARRLEKLKDRELILRKKALIAVRGQMSDAAAEREVIASDSWGEYLDEMLTARDKADWLAAQLEHMRTVLWERNDANASRRAEIKNLGH